MTLHTCNKPLGSVPALALMEKTLLPGDDLLLLEDGVYSVLDGNFLARCASRPECRVYLLGADLAARGISDRIPTGFTAVAYTEFVGLCLQHERVVNWI